MASLKPKLFCGVALKGEKFPSARVNAGAVVNCDHGDAYYYATIIVKRPSCLLVEQRLHPDRTNWTLLLFASDRESETGDYTEVMARCQALRASRVRGEGTRDYRTY